MGEGEDGAEIIVSKLPFITKKRKRKPLVPNKNGIDRIEGVSKSDVHVELKCRLLFRDRNPEEIQVSIPLPRQESIIAKIRSSHPNINPKKLEEAIDKWMQKYVMLKLKRHWKSRKPCTIKLKVESDIGDFE